MVSKMSNDAIPVALTSIYSYLVNGNLAKAHAFYPKSDYINGIDLVAEHNQDCDLEDISCSSDDGNSSFGSGTDDDDTGFGVEDGSDSDAGYKSEDANEDNRSVVSKDDQDSELGNLLLM